MRIPFSFMKSSAVAFAPQSRGDCLSWHDGRVVTIVSGKVAALPNQGPGGDSNRDLVQATAGSRPVLSLADPDCNGEDVVALDGVDDVLQSAADWGTVYLQPTTWYVAFVVDGPIDDSQYIFDGPVSGTSRQAFLGATAFSGVLLGGTGVRGSRVNVLCVTYNGVTSAVYLNGSTTPIVTGDAGTQALIGQTIGARYSLDAGSFLKMRLAAVGTFDGAHDATARAEIMSGLANRYFPAWTPAYASVPLLAWWRPDLGATLTGVQIDTLADQSGLGDVNRNQTGSGPGRPYIDTDAAYGGKSVINYTGFPLATVGDWVPAPTLQPFTIAVVGDTDGTQPNASFIADDSHAATMIWTNNALTRYYNGATDLSGSPPPTSPCLMFFEDDASGAADAAKLFVNNLATPIATNTTLVGSTIVRLNLGFGIAGVSDLSGREAEVIVFDGVLPPTDKAKLVNYFNTTQAYGLPITA